MNDLNQVVKMLGVILKQIGDQPPELLEALAAGKARISIVSDSVKRETGDLKSTLDVQLTGQALASAKTREAAISILEDHAKGKKNLVSLARALNLPIQQEDTIKVLQQRIVESTVGFRLRSDAIWEKDTDSQEEKVQPQ